MDENKVGENNPEKPDADRAENSTITARSEQPEDGTERLKPYRWVKGQSGNPGGRPRTLPITDCLRSVAHMPLPENIRGKLEAVVGKLPKSLTFGEGAALDQWLSIFGMGVGFRLDVARETRMATEGKETDRIEIEQVIEEAPEELRKHIWAKLIETSYKRHKLYNMEMRELEQMASDAGVSLQEAMGDKQLTEGEKE